MPLFYLEIVCKFKVRISFKMHPWLNWIEYLTTDQKVVGSNPTGCTIMKKILLLFALLLFSSCSVIVYKVADIQDINSVTGKYKIGTKRFLFIDSTRTNWYLEDYNKDFRKLMVQVWYPAKIEVYDKKSSYIDNQSALTHTIKNQGYGVPKILSDQIGSIECNSWEEPVPLLGNNFPILIFSHGHGGLRTQNTNQVEELVSHGYVVIAMDHTYDAGFVEFLDGEVAYSLTARSDDNTIIISPEEFYTRFSYRVNDVDFILEEINKFYKYDDDIFNIMNIDKIGIFGHSYGGLTSFYSAFYNEAITSCFALDGWFEPMPDSLVLKNINKPLFHLGQHNKGEIKYWNDLNYEKLENFMKNNSNLSIMIDIPGSYHYDYTDFTYFTYLTKKMNFSGLVPTDTMAKIMNVTLVDFFNHTLKGYEKVNSSIYKEKFPHLNIVLDKN